VRGIVTRFGSRGRTIAVLGCSLALAGLLTASGGRFAASQEAVLTAMKADQEIPVREPWDPFWSRLPRVDLPLSAQQTLPPMGGSRWTLTARAVQDDTSVYIAVEWTDPAPSRSVATTQAFTDAVAVQFPAVASTSVPALCMGDPTATMNIWQWRAAWQADVNRGSRANADAQYPNTDVDGYPFADDPVFRPGEYVGNPFSQRDRSSAVDNLVASGFGSLTADPVASVQGWGQFRNGRWRVVFARPLAIGREGNVDLAPDDWTDVAFAVWDGGVGERNGMKSVGNFVRLNLTSEPLTPAGASFPFWPAPFFAFLGLWVAVGWVLLAWKPQRRPA